PGAELPGALRHDVNGLHRQFLFERSLQHVGRINRNPTDPVRVEFGAAMLRLRDIARLAEALEEAGIRYAYAVNVARRNAERAYQRDEQSIQVGAFSADVAGFEHRDHVAGATPRDVWIANAVFENPVVDRMRLVDGSPAVAGNFRCG